MEGFDFSNIFLYLLILAAIGLGFGLGRRRAGGAGRQVSSRRQPPSNDYFIGLNYLLNDEPDDAIDIFIDALEVNSNTLETHLALGTLLRRRGKVDRSIAVYLDLLGKSGFSKKDVNEIKINLVQSYISAGLFDRAEHLLEELRKEKGNVRIRALELSANVYQQEKEWQEGIQALTELMKVCAPAERQRYQYLASHFYCELAEEEISHERLAKAREHLKQAYGICKDNVRVSILMAGLEESSGNFKEAIRYYENACKLNQDFTADVFFPLTACYLKAGKKKGLEKFINNIKQNTTDTTVLLGIAEYLEKENGVEAARAYLSGMLEKKSSLRVLFRSMALDSRNNPLTPDEVDRFCTVLGEYIDSKAQYQCADCGFEMKTLHWHCPGCSGWGTIRHVRGILGE